MALLRLCNDDPIVSTLTEVFQANLVRIPEERIAPLKALAASSDHTWFRGEFSPLLTGELDRPSLQSSSMPDLTGKKTRTVNVDLGLKILDSYLSGFGVPSATLLTKFQGVTSVSFSFQNVLRKWVDLGALGAQLKNCKIDRRNPAAAVFFGNKPYLLLLIDSVITSSDFSISVDNSFGKMFRFDIGAIQQVVGGLNANVSVQTTNGLDLLFKGKKDLAFAFSCVRLKLNQTSGAIALIEPSGSVAPITFRDKSQPASTQRVLLSRQPAMLSFEEGDL